jgi:hypothetical protein
MRKALGGLALALANSASAGIVTTLAAPGSDTTSISHTTITTTIYELNTDWILQSPPSFTRSGAIHVPVQNHVAAAVPETTSVETVIVTVIAQPVVTQYVNSISSAAPTESHVVEKVPMDKSKAGLAERFILPRSSPSTVFTTVFVPTVSNIMALCK